GRGRQVPRRHQEVLPLVGHRATERTGERLDESHQFPPSGQPRPADADPAGPPPGRAGSASPSTIEQSTDDSSAAAEIGRDPVLGAQAARGQYSCRSASVTVPSVTACQNPGPRSSSSSTVEPTPPGR